MIKSFFKKHPNELTTIIPDDIKQEDMPTKHFSLKFCYKTKQIFPFILREKNYEDRDEFNHELEYPNYVYDYIKYITLEEFKDIQKWLKCIVDKLFLPYGFKVNGYYVFRIDDGSIVKCAK